MRFAAVATILALVLGACAGPAAAPSPSPAARATTAAPTAASPTPKPPETVVLTADLRAANEVPAITNEESTATGNVTVTLTITRDAAGKVATASAKFDFTVSNLLPTTEIVAAHIHKGAAGAAASPITDSLVKAGDVKVVDRAVTVTNATISLKPEVADDLLASPAGFYFNVHSKLNGGGVARGQLQKKA